MAILEYISDENLFNEVRYVVKKTLKKRKESLEQFNKNVVDPFCTLFEAPAFPSHDIWKKSELTRQSQKTIQNHVGTFHQKILGHVDGWEDMKTGSVVDLVNIEKEIIAEVKNKYSTVTGGDLSSKYYSLDGLISPKHSKFKGYTAYFVHVIPKKPNRYNKAFTPSDKEKGALCPENEAIRLIDGASFYELVTGRPNALQELHSALPKIINEVYKVESTDEYSLNDIADFSQYFSMAFNVIE